MSPDQLFDVSGEIVLITGASGQLGGEYVMAFLQRGARVVGLDIRPWSGSAALQAQYPEHYLFCASDVTDKTSLQQALDVVISKFGVPTVLINNAAIDSPPTAPPAEKMDDLTWLKVIDVNLKGVYLCCQVFGAAMTRIGKGSIINVASIYGMLSPDHNLYEYRHQRGETFYKPVAYSASKSGILNLTRYLAVYWAKKNIRVNTLTIAGVFNNQEQAFLDAYCGRIPVGYMAGADDYNGSVLFLASPASRYMTGANLIIDGGWTAI